MSNETVKTVDITPTWEAAVRIYISVLLNEDASEEAKLAAEEDLLRLGRWADEVQAKAKEVDSE